MHLTRWLIPSGFCLLIAVVIATAIGALSETDVIIANDTGLDIAKLEIDSTNFHELKVHERILVTLTAGLHHLHVVFRGGADRDWPAFNFKGVREIFLERHHNEIEARSE